VGRWASLWPPHPHDYPSSNDDHPQPCTPFGHEWREDTWSWRLEGQTSVMMIPQGRTGGGWAQGLALGQGRICVWGCLGCSPGRGPVQVNRPSTSRPRLHLQSPAACPHRVQPPLARSLTVSSSRGLAVSASSRPLQSWTRGGAGPAGSSRPASAPPVVARCPGPVLLSHQAAYRKPQAAACLPASPSKVPSRRAQQAATPLSKPP
jgi:hypothetical protein